MKQKVQFRYTSEIFEVHIATLTKTDSGRWKAIIRRKGSPIVSKTFRIKRDAEDWARTTEDEIVRGVYIQRSDSEKLLISAALARYLDEVTPTKKLSTQAGDKVYAKLLSAHFGRYSLASLTTDKIAAFRDKRIKDGKSNNTVRLDLALLSHLYNTAIREWGIGLAVNPVSNVRKPQAGEGRNRRLEGDEEERLIAACNAHPNPFLGWIVRLALYTGMRRGEIINLTRKDINMSKRTITLKDTKNHAIRTVPLTEKAHKTLREALKFKIKPDDTKLIFFGEPGRTGERKPYTINRVWSQALKRAEIENLKFHDLRHEATSRFVEAGLSDQQVASITGHKSMQMLRRYTHLRSEDLVSKIKNI